MNAISLDEQDQKIIEAFSRDGRASNRQIAQELEVTEGTIRTRVKRLQRRGLLQFTAVRSFKFAGSPNLVMMGIHADQSSVPELAELLAAMPDIGCVVVMLGRFNLIAMGLFTTLEQVDTYINTRIRTLAGVKHVETSIAIHNVKYRSAIARITTANVLDTNGNADESAEDSE